MMRTRLLAVHRGRDSHLPLPQTHSPLLLPLGKGNASQVGTRERFPGACCLVSHAVCFALELWGRQDLVPPAER